MTTAEEKAKEVVETWLSLQSFHELHDEIYSAIREAERDALERAADKCEAFRHPDGSSSWLACSLAAAIRDLKDEP